MGRLRRLRQAWVFWAAGAAFYAGWAAYDFTQGNGTYAVCFMLIGGWWLLIAHDEWRRR